MSDTIPRSSLEHKRHCAGGGPGSGAIALHGGTMSCAAANRAAAAAASELCTAHRVPEAVAPHHDHEVGPDQCCSAVVQAVAAPVSTVWSVVRRFDKPQAYKHFVKSCHVLVGDGSSVGTLREVRVVSGLPAANSKELLEVLDDERHVLSFRIVGGEHRLSNYRSVTTLHASPGAAGEETVVVESYVVDVPPGNTRDDTRFFVDTIVRCNLHSLAHISENIARSRAAAATDSSPY